MAEGYEENVRNLALAASLIYEELRDAFEALPLPIVLPQGIDEGTHVQDLHKSVLEAEDRIGDLPVDGLAATTLQTAAMQWISGSSLMQLYAASHGPSHLAAAEWALEQAVGLADLATSLLRQE